MLVYCRAPLCVPFGPITIGMRTPNTHTHTHSPPNHRYMPAAMNNDTAVEDKAKEVEDKTHNDITNDYLYVQRYCEVFVTILLNRVAEKQQQAGAAMKAAMSAFVQDLLGMLFLPEWPVVENLLYVLSVR